ncbi:MAG: hypothetical protein IJC51_03655 [Eggerthellaceae bacterium]|nr:hypothetical protein [Eggerthellaceae bacterium]
MEKLTVAGAYFRMGAAVAVGELYGLGRAGSAEEARGFLASFGVRGMGDVERLGIKGPYIGEFEEIFAACQA